MMNGVQDPVKPAAPADSRITSISETPEQLLVRVTSHRAMSLCPLCSTPSSAVRNYFRRHPLDLLCAGRPVRLLLKEDFFRATLFYLGVHTFWLFWKLCVKRIKRRC